jgi:membrane protein YdbS with pleckstrin-like domain
VNPWWWVPIGLAAWFLVAIVASLLIGPVLRRSSQARETLDQDLEETPDGGKPSQDRRQASL